MLASRRGFIGSTDLQSIRTELKGRLVTVSKLIHENSITNTVARQINNRKEPQNKNMADYQIESRNGLHNVQSGFRTFQSWIKTFMINSANSLFIPTNLTCFAYLEFFSMLSEAQENLSRLVKTIPLTNGRKSVLIC